MSSRLMLVLHSHIPYVKRHGTWPFGEVWLYEAIAETYLPLLRSWRKLNDEGLNFRLTMGFSPVLLEQLNSKYIKQNFLRYLEERESQARADERYYMALGEKEFVVLANHYANIYRDLRRDYIMEFNRDILQTVKELQDQERLEVITTAATHAYLPLLDHSSLEDQIYWGKKLFALHFGREPKGFWLPECGYFQGVEDILLANGLEYFFVDSHAIEGGKPIESFSADIDDSAFAMEVFAATGLSTYRVYRIKDKDISVFGRNSMVSHQIWSAEYGYPGDGTYREFHMQSPRSGFKYWRITDRNVSMEQKHIYDIDNAERKINQHARHFVNSLHDTSHHARKLGFAQPVIVGCYDTELFGHWWWEGGEWLETVIRLIDQSNEIRLALPSDVGRGKHEAQVFESSWGTGGKHYVWENPETVWMWDVIKKASKEYQKIKRLDIAHPLLEKALAQALKELMLLQSSDWLFMVSNNLTKDYAAKRFFEHYTKLIRISDAICNAQFDEAFVRWLNQISFEDDFFNC